MQNYTYSGKFSGNVLIVGLTECGKTTFMQKLALHNFFGKLKKAEWVSGITLTNYFILLNLCSPKWLKPKSFRFNTNLVIYIEGFIL